MLFPDLANKIAKLRNFPQIGLEVMWAASFTKATVLSYT